MQPVPRAIVALRAVLFARSSFEAAEFSAALCSDGYRGGGSAGGRTYSLTVTLFVVLCAATHH
jgi:hypothetical protein